MESEHIINCDVNPVIPVDGWVIVSHQKNGLWKWHLPALYISEEQKNGFIEGFDIQEQLANKPVLNANVLFYLLNHQELIPDDWKRIDVYFWGTIYNTRSDGFNRGTVVPCLHWNGSEFVFSCRYLEQIFTTSDLAVITETDKKVVK